MENSNKRFWGGGLHSLSTRGQSALTGNTCLERLADQMIVG